MVRDVTRDVVRGLNILEMELVNESDWSLLSHAEIGDKTITYADTVFPTFAFLAGMSSTPARKSVGLIGLGIAFNAIPIIYNPKNFKLRPLGVLQRTGLASLIYNAAKNTKYPYLFSVAATALWYGLSVILSRDWSDPFKTPEGSAQTYIDEKIIGQSRLYKPEYDPEGLLGSLTTAITLDFGNKFASEILTLPQSLAVGVIAITSGFVLSKLFPKKLPMSKPYWTPSFVLAAGGFSIVKYACVAAAVPYLPEPVQYVLTCLGRRSLEVYLSGGLLLSVANKFGLWKKLKSKLVDILGPRAGDLTICSLWQGLLAGLAVAYVKYGIKVKY